MTSVVLQRAVRALEDGNPTVGESLLLRHLEEHPDDAWARSLLASCRLALGRVAAARSDAEHVVELAPAWDEGHALLGQAHLAEGRIDHAEVAARDAVRTNPERADHHAFLATILLMQGRRRHAADAAAAGLEHDGRHAGCARLRAMALLLLDREAEATGAVELLTSLDADGADGLAGRGWLHLMGGRHGKGTAALRHALRREPDNLLARIGVEKARTLYHPGWRLAAVVGAELADWGGIAFMGVVVLLAVFHRPLAERAPVAFPFLAVSLSLPLALVRTGLPALVRRRAPELDHRMAAPGTLRRRERLLGRTFAVAALVLYLALAALVFA